MSMTAPIIQRYDLEWHHGSGYDSSYQRMEPWAEGDWVKWSDLANKQQIDKERADYVRGSLLVVKDRLIRTGASVAPCGSHERVALAMLCDALRVLEET